MIDKQIKDKFSPKVIRPEPTEADFLRTEGLIVNNFPKTLSDEEIHKFLKDCFQDDIDETRIKLSKSKKNISATVEPLSPEQVQKATKLIHFPNCKQKFFQNPLYCRAIRTLSPENQHQIRLKLTQVFLMVPKISPTT